MGNASAGSEETIHCETLYKDEHCTMRLTQCEPAGCCAVGGGSKGNLSLLVVVAGLLLRRRRELTKRARRPPVIATLVLHACLFGLVLGCAEPDGDGPLNNPPTARFKATLTSDPLIGRLDATRTFEPDGDAVVYAWTVAPLPGVDAPVLDIDGPLATVVASAPGRYEVELVATDEHGAASTASHALHLFDAAFPSVIQTLPFGNPVYAWSTRQLYFPGGTPGVLDVASGVLATDALQGSVSGFAVAPNGRGVLVMPLGGSVTYYDSMSGMVLGSTPAGSNTVAADDAIYWTSNDSAGVGLAKYDLDQQQVFIAGPSTEYQHPPIVSTALSGVIVPIGTWDSVERFEIYDFGSPPALVATIAASVPWGRVDALDGGDRIVVPGGPVYRISRESLEVLAAFGDDYRALAHNPTIGAFAVLNSLRLRVYSDQTFELLADYDLAGAIGSVGWQRIFRHERGFMVVQTGGARIHSLYVEP